MAKFNFICDQKCTIWERNHITVDAETYEEAIKFIKEHRFDEPDYMESTNDCVSFEESELLYDTQDYMSVHENGGCETLEWIDENHCTITNNLP